MGLSIADEGSPDIAASLAELLMIMCFPLYRPLFGLFAAFIVASAALAAPLPAPEGPAFYDPPPGAVAGKPGTLIWARPFSGAMALPSAGRNLLLLYVSRAPGGRPVAVSGTLAVPPGPPPAGGWPIVDWTHGTMGLTPDCAPSLVPKTPPNSYVDGVAHLLDALLREGYAVVATDYQGLGTKGPHPYLEGAPNAGNALDLLPAAARAEPSLGRRFLIIGHSQGGQAALFAGGLAAVRAPGFRLVGDMALAPVSQVGQRLEAFLPLARPEPLALYVVAALQAYARDDRQLDLSRVLSSAARTHLPELQAACRFSPGTGFWAETAPRDIFVPGFDVSSLRQVLERQEPGRLAIKVPTLIVAGGSDGAVPPPTAAELSAQLCARGAPVAFKVGAWQDHMGVVTQNVPELVAWVKARFKGVPLADACQG